jgi:hypothetical protein
MKNVERDVLGIQRSAGGSQGGAAKFVQKDAEMSTKVDLTGIAGEDARFKESCWYGAAVVEIWAETALDNGFRESLDSGGSYGAARRRVLSKLCVRQSR